MPRLAVLPLLVTSLLAAVPAARADVTAPAADPFTATLVDPQPAAMPAAPGRVLVRFEADASASQQQAALDDVGGDVARALPIPQAKVVELPAGASPQAAAADLEDDPGVRWAQPDYRVSALATPSDPLFSQLWGMQKISAPQAWDLATGSTSTVVAVVDTGVDLTNPELASELVPGHDWVDGDNVPQDQHGHGTHVSGTIGGIANNGIGVAGVNWRVSIMPLRVLNAQGSGWTSDIASAFAYAGQHGAKVVSASLGGSGDDPALHDAIAQSPNTLYVIAAGNSSRNNDAVPTWPCNVKAANEICVAATDSNDNLASFSNYGASTVQIAAPGVGILSTLPNGQYAAWNGTSMATPHVSGAAALLFSAKPGATVAEVRAAILNGADRLPQLTGRVSTGGRLNVFRALQLLGAKPMPVVTTGAAQGATTTSTTLTGTVDGRGEATTWHFDYGTTTAYGQRTADQPLAGSGAQPVTAAITGLLAGLALHYRLVATSPGGTVNGVDLTTSTTTAPPDALTGAATGVTWRAATLAGTVNPQGLATTWHLDYGRTTAYGSRTPEVTLPAGSWSAQAVSSALSTLRAGAPYHYRVVAVNAAGTTNGADQTFLTAAPAAPRATTGGASSVGATDATLAASIDPSGAPTRYVFQYGPTPAYGDSTAPQRLPAADGAVAVSAQLPDLLPSTLYHYRVLTISAAGTTAGADATFVSSRTPGARSIETFADDGDLPALGDPVGIAAAAPQVVSTGVLPEQTRADALGFVTANGGATTVFVQYGADATYGSQTAAVAVSAAASAQLVDVPLEGLAAGATLHARLVAQNALGTSYGEDETFTLAPAGPQADTAAAHAVASRSAELDALVDAGGSATDYRFEWGTSTAYGGSTASSSAGTDAGRQAVGATLSGLTPGTTYHARVVARSARGTAYGRDVTFTTDAAGASVATDATAGTTLYGALNPGGEPVTAHFEYGPTTAYGQTTADETSGTDASFRELHAAIAGLAPGTYHARLVATGPSGTRRGGDVTFTVAPAGPVATAYIATEIGSTNARLGGWIDPAHVDATVHFDYGTTTGYGKRTPDVVLNGDAGEQWVAARPTGLAPNTTYHARLVSVGADGTQAVSADVTFTTALAGPTLGAAGAASVGSSSASLDVQVDPNGQPTRYHVDYGDDASYGRSTADVDAGSAEAFADLEAHLAGLDPSTTYHYRVVATNASGTSYGPDGTFTTASAGPTLGPPNILHPAARSGEVSLAVDPNGQATTLHVEYGTTTAYGQRSADVAVDAASGDQAAAVTLRGLTPATDYHLRVVATNASGTQSTDDLPFTTEVAGPTVLTGDALAAGRSATLAGQINPNGEVLTYRFEYGKTTAYGTTTPEIALPAGDDFADASADVVGLAADTTYHVRLVATFAGGTRYGDDATFATDQPGPSVSTGAATAVTGYAASIAGSVNPNGLASTWRFEYGPTTAYGSATATQSLAAGYRTGAVSAALAGLVPGRAYHYRVAATNASGTKYGDDATFTTTPLPPDVTTGAASSVGTHTATIALQVNPNGDATSYRVEYGITTAYQQQAAGTSVGSGTGVVTAMQSLTGLAPGTLYHYRVVAWNGTGETAGQDATFRTVALTAPLVTSLAVSGVGRTGVTVGSTIGTSEQATTVTVQYGLTTAYGSSTAPAAMPTDGTFSQPLAGLVPGTTYHYRLVAANATGTTTTPDATFGTAPLPAPVVSSGAAEGIGRTAATVHGRVDPSGLATTWRIEYGATIAYGQSTATVSTVTPTDAEDVTATLSGLSPDTTYHWRVVAQNSTGTTRSGDQSFDTDPLPAPSIDAVDGAADGRDTGTLTARVTAGGLATTAHFEWGTGTAYGQSTPDVALAGSASSATITAHLTGLVPGGTYHLRVVATNATGTTRSSDVAFTTDAAIPPAATTGAASQVTRVSATLAGSLDGYDLPATYRFEYGPTTAYGSTTAATAAGSGPSSVAAGITGLIPGATYHYRLVVSTSAGQTTGSDAAVTTAPPLPPAASFPTATPNSPHGALLGGSLDGRDLAATYSFEYGTTTGYGSTTQALSLAADAGPRQVSVQVDGLDAVTTYHYRLVVTNAAGTTRSADATFVTPAFPAPKTTVLAADALTMTGATLHASVDPSGLATTYHFEYGSGATYQYRTGDVALPSATAVTAVFAAISGLSVGSDYHYRVVAVNATGQTASADARFTTLPYPRPALVSIAAPSAVTRTGLTVGATVDPGGLSTSVYAEYGVDTGYGHTTTAVTVGSVQAVTFPLAGFAPGTAVHYRLVATSDAGTTRSADRTATTAAPIAPSATTGAASAVTRTTVTLTGTANGNDLPVGYRFEYGTTAAYGKQTATVDPASGVQTAWIGLSGLVPGTAYHYRLIAVSDAGETPGADATFTTAAPIAPTAATGTAITVLSYSSAAVSGTANGNGLPVDLQFEYGPTTAYGTRSQTASLPAATYDQGIGMTLTGLWPSTTYHVRLVATSSAGTSTGVDRTFTTPPPPPPLAVPNPATSVTQTGGVLNGLINPYGSSTTYRFEWGTTTAYGNQTTSMGMGAVLSATAISAPLTGLVPNTTYHYRVYAANASGVTRSADFTFTTQPLPPPGAASGAASAITRSAATIAGTVTPNGQSTSYRIEYGTGAGYGSATAWVALGSATGTPGVSVSLSGLAAGTTYHYRLAAQSATGTGYGDDRTFTTLPPTPPTLTTSTPTGLGRTTATLRGTVNPNGLATTSHFEFGTTAGYGSSTAAVSAGSGSTAVSASASLANLAPATTYHYRLVAVSPDGTANGPDQTFTTDPDVAPGTVSGAADGLTRTAAVLHGTVNPNGQATTWHVEYGKTTSYGTSTPDAPAGNGFADVAVAAPLGDVLAPGTTYHYRVVATNATGTTKGADQAFTTGAPVLADASTGAAGAISEFGARVAGSVNPNASATAVWFEYGTDTTYAGRIDAAASLTGTGAQAVSAVLGGLAPATTYHYRVAARNAVGTSYGPDQVLTTAAATAASTTTAPASQVGIVAATLNGYVSTGSYATSVSFEWGLDTGYGQSTPVSTLPASSGGQATAAALTGLQPKTTYHYRLVATNPLGSVRGADQTLTTQPLPPPALGAVQAAGATVSAATLSGSAVPNGLPTVAHFEWGTTTAYGSRGADVSLGSGTDAQTLTLPLGGLSAATTYHYRLVAANETGTSFGADMTFATLNPAPTTATGAASGVGPTQATLGASVNPNGIAATVRFEYGPTTAYGATTGALSVGNGWAARAMTAAVTGLSAHTTYHYRAVATNATGTTYGDDQTVTTAWFAVPAVTTDAETGTTYASTTLHGHVNPNGARTTYRFEYGPTAAYGAATTERLAGDALVSGPVTADLQGLAAGTAYHVRLVATNETGTSYGEDRVFTTPAWLAPTAVTGATLQLAGTSVTLVGRVDANDAATTFWFEYGPTAAYGAATAPAQASGRVQVQVAAPVGSLTPGTTYHYRLVARSAGGTTAGADATLTTPSAHVADQAAPTVKIAAPTCPASVKGKACTAWLQSTTAWKTLKGTVTDASGVDSVEVSLWRKGADGKCFAYSGDGFKALRCDKAAAVWVDAAVLGASWKLALRSLPAGTYTLRVRASDTAGNDVSAFRAGQNQLNLKLASP